MNIRLELVSTEGPLPTSTYDAYDGDVKIGMAQLRHKEAGNPTLPENMRSHVYYEVEPAYQGKGYGTKILELIKNEAKLLGMHELFLTAFDTNIGSNKIIQKNGGEYLWDYINPEGKRLLKYKISL